MGGLSRNSPSLGGLLAFGFEWGMSADFEGCILCSVSLPVEFTRTSLLGGRAPKMRGFFTTLTLLPLEPQTTRLTYEGAKNGIFQRTTRNTWTIPRGK